MQPSPNTTLGELFRERRTHLGMSMREVAGTMLSPTAVNNIEKGKFKPTIETVLYLCSVLDLAPELALIHCSDFMKSAPALLEIVDRKLAARAVESAHTLLYDMCWVVSEQERYEVWLPEIHMRLGLAQAQLARYETAKQLMNQAYYGFFEQKNIGQKIVTLYHIGTFEFTERHLDVAMAFYRRALDVVQRYQYCDRSVGDVLYALAEAYLLQRKPENALRVSLWAEHVYRQVLATEATARTQLQLACIQFHLDRLVEAEQLALLAKQFFAGVLDQEPATFVLGQASRVLGDVYAASQRWDEARTQYAEGIAHIGTRDRPERFEIERGLAEVALQLQDLDLARRHIWTALMLCATPVAPEACTPPLEFSTGMQVLEDATSMQDLASGETGTNTVALTATHLARAYQLLARCEQLANNRAGYVHAMNAACTTLLEAGDPLHAALLQTQLADETEDWDLMRTATQTLRQLHDRLR